MKQNDASPSSAAQILPAGRVHETPLPQAPAPASRHTPLVKNAVFLAMATLYRIVFVGVARLATPGMAATSAMIQVIAAAWRFNTLAARHDGLALQHSTAGASRSRP